MARLEVVREFDPWKSPLCTCPRKYSLHPYTGCSHFCLYCYAISYIGVKGSRPKDRLLERLAKDLQKIEHDVLVELSTSSDPYPPIEKEYRLTRGSLEVLSRFSVRVLITTKSDLVVRDADMLLRMPSAVMVTVTTLDEKLAKVIEPGAPEPEKRLHAVRELSKLGIPVGVRVDPVIPFINDDRHTIEELIGKIAEVGALHVATSTYKAKWINLKRLSEAFSDVARKIHKLYREEGRLFQGYLYLPRNMRRALLEPIVRFARVYGLTYASCREGLGPEFFGAPTCDGSHLIERHVKVEY